MKLSNSNQHLIDACKARGYDITFALGAALCEWCPVLIVLGLQKNWGVFEQGHHVSSSFRGKRKHNKDGSDILLCCHECHNWIHQHNNQEIKEIELLLISRVIEYCQYALSTGYDPQLYIRNKKDSYLTLIQSLFHSVSYDVYHQTISTSIHKTTTHG